jgi:type II secretory pathway component GspD/PulD (secretin)
VNTILTHRGCFALIVAVVAGWLACAAPVATRADELASITLQHRTAEDLIPLLQPLLPAGAVVTGAGDVLLVRADAATLAQLRTAVAAFDRAPRQLMITVGQSTSASARGGGIAGSATIGSGDVEVGVNRPPQPGTSGATVIAGAGSTQDTVRNVSTVRALEGFEVFIAVGESRPYTTTTVTPGPWGTVTTSRSTGFRDASSGFYAIPRLSGERVTLEISPRQQRFTGSARNGTIASQSLTTRASGRLGEWIELGGVDEVQNGTATGLVLWGTRAGAMRYSAWVKVDEVR